MGYLAKIDNGVVTQVIVASSVEWAEKYLGGNWILAIQQVGIGWSYDGTDFIPPEIEVSED